MLAACQCSDNHTNPCVLNWWNNLRISLFIAFSDHSKTTFLFKMTLHFFIIWKYVQIWSLVSFQILDKHVSYNLVKKIFKVSSWFGGHCQGAATVAAPQEQVSWELRVTARQTEAIASTTRGAVSQHLNKESRAGLVTATRVSYSPVISKDIVIRQVQGQTRKSSQQGKDRINKVHGQVQVYIVYLQCSSGKDRGPMAWT